MIPLEEALRIVLERTPRLPPEEVPLQEAAGGWLVEEVRSDVDLPPADVSAMDGYALRAADTVSAPVELQVVGEVAAGAVPEVPVGSGQAVRIMTGAPLPDGADAVQMVEHTEALQDGAAVRVLEAARAGRHIRRRGENLRDGEVILPAGSRLGPSEIGVLASAGRARISLPRRPRVALIPTGDELVEPDGTPGPGQIRNSNGPMLQVQLAAAGATVDYLGIAHDDEAELDRLIADGLRRDLLVLCGGVSMGVYDLVTAALQRAGVEVLFEKIAVKPGKPTVFGVHPDGALVFGLPGNPVAGRVIGRLLLAPALRRMQGSDRPGEERLSARLSGRLQPTARRECYHPARIVWSESGYVARPVMHHGSGDLVAWRGANGMIRLPADAGAEEGDRVEILADPDRDLR